MERNLPTSSSCPRKRSATNLLRILGGLSLALGMAWQHAVLASDPIYRMQVEAVVANRSPIAHWGWNQDSYTQWSICKNNKLKNKEKKDY